MIEKFVSPNRDLAAQDVYNMLEVISKFEAPDPAEIFFAVQEVQAAVTVAACTDSLAGELNLVGTTDIDFALLEIQQIHIQYLKTVMVDQTEADQVIFEQAFSLAMVRTIQKYMISLLEQFNDVV